MPTRAEPGRQLRTAQPLARPRPSTATVADLGEHAVFNASAGERRIVRRR
jgi:hypothetical protein